MIVIKRVLNGKAQKPTVRAWFCMPTSCEPQFLHVDAEVDIINRSHRRTLGCEKVLTAVPDWGCVFSSGRTQSLWRVSESLRPDDQVAQICVFGPDHASRGWTWGLPASKADFAGV